MDLAVVGYSRVAIQIIDLLKRFAFDVIRMIVHLQVAVNRVYKFLLWR
jgi:hypothetical protein